MIFMLSEKNTLSNRDGIWCCGRRSDSERFDREEKMRMKNKVVLVMGGATEIGKAAALWFSEEGARVIICDVNEEAGNVTMKELSEGRGFL